MTGSRRRLPGWAGWGLVLVLVGLGWYGWRFLGTPAVVRAAAAELRTTSVVVSDGAPSGVLDVDRTTQVIGDRPIVVVVLPEDLGDGDRRAGIDACDDITARLRDVLAVVYVGDRGPSTCLGSGFPAPDPDLANAAFTAEDAWLFQLELSVDAAARFRLEPGSADRTPEIEELVLAFDVARGLTGPVERRELAASPSVLGRTVVLLVGLVLGAFTLVALLQLAVVRVRRRAATVRARRERRLALTVDLAAVADAVLRDGPARLGAGSEVEREQARVRADVAGRYVLTLTDVEAARSDAELAAATRTVADLRGDADRLLPTPTRPDLRKPLHHRWLQPGRA